MSTHEIVGEIKAAFADVKQPEGLAPILTLNDAIIDIEDIFLLPDEAKKYTLPRMMCFSVIEDEPTQRPVELVRRLVEFLDADFYDPSNQFDDLKEVRIDSFFSYSEAQARAIVHWLKYVEGHFPKTIMNRESHYFMGDQLNSALLHWSKRAHELPTG